MKLRMSRILQTRRSAISLLIVFGVAAGLVYIWRSTLVFYEVDTVPVHFDTYVASNTLIYVKTPCRTEHIQHKFFLHIFPFDTKDLPAHRVQSAFDNLDFNFNEHGTMTGGKCVAAVPLPDYRASSIRTGQYQGRKRFWEDEFPLTDEMLSDRRVFASREFTHNYPITIKSFLYALHLYPIELKPFFAWGGAIEALGDDLLVATTRGKFVLVYSDGSVSYLDARVPMNESGLESYDNPKFDPVRFRIADILVKQKSSDSGHFELFVTHHYFNENCFVVRLSSTTILREEGYYRVSQDWQTVFDAEPCLRPPFSGELIGGKMLTDGAEHLLVIIGDSGRGKLSQDLASHMGKLLRVNIATGHAEVLTSGHRNPQGLARDRNGALWATEHGPQGGDELNRIRDGHNYGWPHVSYGIQYGSRRLSDTSEVSRHEGYTKPVFSWVPSIGSSSLTVNDPREFPLWHDDLLVGSIVGGSNESETAQGRSLFRIRRHGTDVQYVEKIEIGKRIRDMTHMSDGRLALLSGNWVLLVRRSDAFCDEGSDWQQDIYALHCGPIPEDATAGMPEVGIRDDSALPADRLFSMHCGRCHSLTESRHAVGPHLVNVIGRRAGQVDGYEDFSPAFLALDLSWSHEDLRRFLQAPQEFAPGTTMVTLDISEAEVRAIIDLISGDKVDVDKGVVD